MILATMYLYGPVHPADKHPDDIANGPDDPLETASLHGYCHSVYWREQFRTVAETENYFSCRCRQQIIAVSSF